MSLALCKIPIIEPPTLAELALLRDVNGSVWCRKQGAGMRRRALEAGPLDVTSPEYERRIALADFCAECGRCTIWQA